MTDIRDIICCPICKSSFRTDKKSILCNGTKCHCFDIASSGYVNLLPPGKEKNAKTGDDAEMINARKRFLASGCYDGISKRIGEIISSLAKENGKEEVSFVDCGCGEGKHTCNIIKTVAEKGLPVLGIGFDASKKGAEGASKLMKTYGIENAFLSDLQNNEKAFFAAGNIFTLPVKENSVDFAVSMFAPIAGTEDLRILRDDGYLIVAASGAHHLVELRELLYDEVRLSSGETRCPEGFQEKSSEILTYKTIVEGNSLIRDLFTMTPFYYRTSETDKAKLDKVDSLSITVEVLITVFSPSE